MVGYSDALFSLSLSPPEPTGTKYFKFYHEIAGTTLERTEQTSTPYMHPQTKPVLFGALPDFIFLLKNTIINSSVGNNIFRNQEHTAICEVGKFSLFFGHFKWRNFGWGD